jgi:hypothetical protein
MRILILSILAATGSLAAACGDADSAPSGNAIRPFEEVQASEMMFEADPADPGRGIFRVTTSEPMICANVWGPTKALGRFNNSLAMSGTGITEHDVFLPGAEPGVTYRFLVQGTTADGQLYRSELGEFTIAELEGAGPPEAGGEPSEGLNAAVDATVVDASSEFSTAWTAGNAVDDDTSTEWSTAGDGDDGHITLDLGEQHHITGVEFVTRSMADGTGLTHTYTATVDDTTFGPFAAGTPATQRVQRIDITGRTVRFDVESSTGGNTGAVEVRVYESE